MKLKESYQKEILPKLIEKFGYKNKMAAPRLEKVTVNVGVGRFSKDNDYIENVEDTLTKITGQRPVKTKAKKSISAFKIRVGMIVGEKVTMRRQKMYDFIEKLISITLPRTRDFRGLSAKAFDRQGNFTLGVKEHIAFPEILVDNVDKIHGLEICISTTAKNKEEGLELLKLIGFPFKEDEKK
ncbi:50S ribosomal protein L5 [Candidatus Falkowbacteria bacterium CG10_big_fil_rev_8_21_14_0_10_43_10]|uniref:Large ribosomal subunit protein uL5 n=1 Tax=Candidatus Falkowbacteria bacterium CG10_big_fil_rev_8_21_14_0_10_43_10 TaxID=1974567 RepID=A0A2H0V2L4_9BACT|nr:MAG: 50S ribosomal protein L5 [Candidatus Falkowbacteria bacterium CG10_big_fil_rev_8_21_14_0_10_43_10]